MGADATTQKSVASPQIMTTDARCCVGRRMWLTEQQYVHSVPDVDVMTVATDAGMLALWRGTAFADVDGYEAWEEQVHERLDDAIRSGELVPIGIQGDGAFGVRVAVAPDAPTERETMYAVVTSEPYLLMADGWPIHISGLEAVGTPDLAPITLSLPKGRYAVRATLVAWDEEPGVTMTGGTPGPDALADFLVTISPSDGSESFRTSQATFDPPE